MIHNVLTLDHLFLALDRSNERWNFQEISLPYVVPEQGFAMDVAIQLFPIENSIDHLNVKE